MTLANDEFKVEIIKTGEAEVPAPEVYWMQGWEAWEKLSFHVVLAYNEKRNFLINTGLPLDLKERNAAMIEFAGKRSIFIPNKRTEDLLLERNLRCDEIQNVSFTPIQDYTIGRLDLFDWARIFIPKKGWIEDIVSPRYAKHLPRSLFIPDKILGYLIFNAWERVSLVDAPERVSLIPGIEMLWVGCHHRSSVAFIINTKEGRVIFTDCSFKSRNIEKRIPIGIAEDTLECLDAYEILSNLGRVLPAYDPEIDELSIG
ncbi:MAG: hypothetical protein QXU18_07235 [Thermoplasmatales archaeon]